MAYSLLQDVSMVTRFQGYGSRLAVPGLFFKSHELPRL